MSSNVYQWTLASYQLNFLIKIQLFKVIFPSNDNISTIKKEITSVIMLTMSKPDVYCVILGDDGDCHLMIMMIHDNDANSANSAFLISCLFLFHTRSLAIHTLIPFHPPLALWSGTNKNRDVSIGPLARPFPLSLTPLTHSLASRYSLAHFAHS